MPDSVVERVARRLDISEDQSARLVHAVGELIQVQLTRDGIVHVPGIGLLTRTEDKIDLEPDQSLLATVNGSFAGLEPVHFGPSDADAAKASKESEAEQEPAVEPAPLKVPIREDRAPRRARKKAWRSPLGLVVGTLLLVATGTALVFQFGMPRLSTETAITEQSPDPVTPTPASEDPIPQPVDPAEAIAVEENNVAEASEPLVQRSSDGYTIVVASFETESVAMAVAQQHRDRLAGTDVLVDVMRSSMQGNTVFRVIVGQAPTVDSAVALRAELTELPADAWITRIRPDN